ncbi:MAG TPA: hypothetical protein VFO29_04675 [Candidatus Rubrimentiphilum sp.]|nr:hypothetical protein [Candidatus Rubrimentiphilum sp.]
MSMDMWFFWTLIALSTAGALLALIGIVQTLAAGIRLKRRLTALRESPFVTKLESLQIQVDRLARSTADAQELAQRLNVAVESMRTSVGISGFDSVRQSWQSCAVELRAMVEELS